MIIKDLGAVSAYAYAVEKGYTGTEEEFAVLMASYATVAEEAAESAESASQSASTASASAQTATSKASEASTSATQAGASATSASQSASTASTKASEASASASTASSKASQASASATTASTKASEASQSASDASTAKTGAETAQGLAESAKDDAETARDLAQQYAESIDPDNIFSAYATDTASGSEVSFADGADDIPVKSCIVNIEPVQSGSGDPSPDNVRPISGWTGAQVVRSGVNVWDEEWESGFINNNGENEDNTFYFRSKNYIPIVPGATYYYKCPTSYSDYARFRYYDQNKQFVSQIGTSNLVNRQFTVPTDAYYMRFTTGEKIGAGVVYNHDISINYPATDTDYHPYYGDVYSITFPAEAGTVYGGELDITNGTLTVDRAMVDLGTLSWGFDGTIFYTASAPLFGGNGLALVNNTIIFAENKCEIYKSDTVTLSNPVNGRFFVANSQATPILRVSDNRFSDVASFKTAMDGVMAIFKLKESVIYHLTPTEIKSLLGENNVWADAGDTEVTYRADTKLYIDKKIAEVVNALS